MPDAPLALALEHFLQQHKGEVGLSKSEQFNRSILAVALRDAWARGIASELSGGGRPLAAAPELVMFLRGTKHTLALVLTAARKALFRCFGQETLGFFDELGEKSPVVSSPSFGAGFWPALERHLRKRHDAFIEQAVVTDLVQPFFAEIIDTITRGTTPGKEEVESGTLTFAFKKERQIAEILSLLGEGNALPHVEDAAPIDHGVADYVEAREHLIGTFLQRQPTLARIRDLVSRAAATDRPKKGDPVAEKRKTAARLFSTMVEMSCEGTDDFNLSMEKKTSTRKCPETQTEFRAVHAEVTGYVRGVLAAAESLLLDEMRDAAMRLGVGKAYDKTILAGSFDVQLLGRFLEEVLVSSVLDGMGARLRRLIQDLRNEGVVKEFNDASLHVTAKGTGLLLQVSLPLARNGPFARSTGLLLTLNPVLGAELARCASLVEPLAHLLSLWQKKDPAAAARMVGDPSFARRLGQILHLDYGFKSLLLADPGFLSFVLGSLREDGFTVFMGRLASANAKIRRIAVADPRILRTIWLVEKKYPAVGFAEAVLSRPMELQGLADSLNTPDGVSVFLKKFIAALRQEGGAPAS